MTISKLQQLLPNDELHYLSDCDDYAQPKGKDYIIFEYTVECWPETIAALDAANIDYTIKDDHLSDLQYIIL